MLNVQQIFPHNLLVLVLISGNSSPGLSIFLATAKVLFGFVVAKRKRDSSEGKAFYV
jgi:mannitol-specific phosphotransferase system IIBC component